MISPDMTVKEPQKLKAIKRERGQKTSARKGQTITKRKRHEREGS